jgi:hypothetical protein
MHLTEAEAEAEAAEGRLVVTLTLAVTVRPTEGLEAEAVLPLMVSATAELGETELPG